MKNPNLTSFFYYFFTFLIFIFIILDLFRLLGTKNACSASYGIKKLSIRNPPGAGKKPSTYVPLVWNQPHTSYTK